MKNLILFISLILSVKGYSQGAMTDLLFYPRFDTAVNIDSLQIVAKQKYEHYSKEATYWRDLMISIEDIKAANKRSKQYEIKLIEK